MLAAKRHIEALFAHLPRSIEQPEDDTYEHILAHGDVAIPTLLRILSEAQEPATIHHAGVLLSQLKAPEALPALVGVLERTPPEDRLHRALTDEALPHYQEVALPVMWRAYSEANDPERRLGYLRLLVALDVADPRIWGALCARLDEDPARVAPLVARYPDSRRGERLRRRFDQLDPNAVSQPDDLTPWVALRHALEACGQLLDPPRLARYEAAQQHASGVTPPAPEPPQAEVQEPKSEAKPKSAPKPAPKSAPKSEAKAKPAVKSAPKSEAKPPRSKAKRARRPQGPPPVRNRGEKVGRNDPCWCGSGKKYKQCHLQYKR